MNSDMNTNDGGPIHPIKLEDGAGGYQQLTGISLRDWFAAKAMQGLLAADEGGGGTLPITEWVWSDFACCAYKMSDAMLAARGDGGPK